MTPVTQLVQQSLTAVTRRLETLVPRSGGRSSVGQARGVERGQVVVEGEGLIGHSQQSLGLGDGRAREGRAVGLAPVHHGGRRVADVRAHDDQSRALGLGDRLAGRRLQHVEVRRPIAHDDDVPAVGREARRRVVTHRQLRRAVDGDVVVVVEDGQAVQPERTGQCRRLVTEAFLQAPVARDDPSAVIDQVVPVVATQDALGQGHADPVGDPLAQWPRRDLHGGRHAVLGVSRRPRERLAEVAQVLQGEVVTEEVGESVLQDRDVSTTEDEAVPVRPRLVAGIVAQHP